MSLFRALFMKPVAQSSVTRLVLYRIRWAIVTLVGLFVVSSAFYVAFENYSVLDGAFMTVITLSTVGYGEVHPLNAAGRVFTIGEIIAGFGTLAYAGALISTLFTSGEIAEHLRKSKAKRMRDDLSDHIIVVGFGRVGQAAARGVTELGRQCVVMDLNAERERTINDAGFAAMIGDATDEVDLKDAGIERAIALVAAAEEDSVNLIVTLTARAICPNLRIISRVNEETWEARMVRAGASVAQSPYRSYGLSLAASAVNPTVLGMHALPVLGMVTEEIEVSASSSLIGLRLGELGSAHEGVLVIGLRRDRQFHRWNEIPEGIEAADVLVALGSPHAVESLAREG